MTPRYTVRLTEVRLARESLVTQAQGAKKVLISEIEAGERNYVRLRERLDQYIETLKAADVLAGYAKMEEIGD